MFTFSPSLFLEAIISRVWDVLCRGFWVAVVYLCEQGAVSLNKYTRGKGRQDLFDHTLSKEIFDSRSSLFLFLYLTPEFIISVGRVVKRLRNVGPDQHEMAWNLLRILVIFRWNSLWLRLECFVYCSFNFLFFSEFNHWLCNSSSSPVWLHPTRITPKVFLASNQITHFSDMDWITPTKYQG